MILARQPNRSSWFSVVRAFVVSSLSTVTVDLGGVDAQVGYAGPQDAFIGLDQINVRIPRELAGRGDVLASLRADGIAANTVVGNIN